jgi:DNA-binding protein YbaB
MFDKLMQAQQKMQETKERLESIQVLGEAEGGKVKVAMTGNKKVISVEWADELNGDKEQLQDLLVIAFNRANELAENVSAAEMQAVASQMLPGGLGALGNLFGGK